MVILSISSNDSLGDFVLPVLKIETFGPQWVYALAREYNKVPIEL